MAKVPLRRIYNPCKNFYVIHKKHENLPEQAGKSKPAFTVLYTIIILISILLCRSMASAAEIFAFQSINIQPYNNALKGFKSACNCNVKQFIVSEMGGIDILNEIRKTKPEVILAIGADTLNRLKSIEKIPVVYFMILNPQSVIPDKDNITGVSLFISPEKQLSVLKQALPDVKSIGLLYDPVRTANFIKKSQLAANAMGIKLIKKEIHSSKEVPIMLKSMQRKIDAFWMLPDETLVTPGTVELLILFSIENKLPLITFSDIYVELGALISLNIDPFDIGKQAWDITGKILSGTDIKEIERTGARKINITINQNVAKKLEINISKDIYNKARVIKRNEPCESC